MTFSIDRRAELRMLAAYQDEPIRRVMSKAVAAGAKAGRPILRDATPIGRGELDARYRKAGLRHGTFRRSVRYARIRRPDDRRDVGYVVGPMGARGWIRAFVEKRTGFASQAASRVVEAMTEATDAVLTAYAEARR